MKSELASFQHRMGVTQSDFAVKLWLKCWVVIAKTMAIVFKDSFTKVDYDELQKCLSNEQMLLSQVLLLLFVNWFYLLIHLQLS